MSKQYVLLLVVLSFIIGSCQQKKEDFAENIKKIDHVVVIYMENHSFDNLWGGFKGANGLANAPDSTTTQVNKDGVPYKFLPEIPGSSAFPTNLPNNYFNIDQYLSSSKESPNPTHLYYHEIMQINGGKMNKFAVYDRKKGMSMGYYTTKNLPLYPIAKEYTLCDNFFHSGFGGSYFNHIYFIAAAPAEWPDAPSSFVAKLDESGKMITDGKVTPDGYAVNTVVPAYPPHPAISKDKQLPPQTIPTIGDRMSEKNISWAWYEGGWNKSVAAGEPRDGFAFNHAPFIYFKNYGPGTEGRKKHLKDETDFLKAAKEGTLPSVSFVKPKKEFDEHPGYSTVYKGETHAVELINAVKNSPNWSSTLVVLTYDENGGFWDHVPPPKIDRWGPGSRIPAIVISPFAKKGYVDHTQYETVSILSFIEKRWGLKPLTHRDKNANPLRNVFDFSS